MKRCRYRGCRNKTEAFSLYCSEHQGKRGPGVPWIRRGKRDKYRGTKGASKDVTRKTSESSSKKTSRDITKKNSKTDLRAMRRGTSKWDIKKG